MDCFDGMKVCYGDDLSGFLLGLHEYVRIFTVRGLGRIETCHLSASLFETIQSFESVGWLYFIWRVLETRKWVGHGKGGHT